MTQQPINQTIIIGGGVAGLTTACLLAQEGHKVTLLEKNRRWGGRAITREKDGYFANLGPHAVYRNAAIEPTMAKLGIELHGNPPVINNHAKIQYQNKLYALPATPKNIFSSSLLTAKEKLGFANVSLKLLRAKPTDYRQISWQQWADENIPSPHLRAFMTANIRISTYANDPDLMRAEDGIRQMQRVLKSSVIYLDKGWQQWVDVLVAKATALGVDLRLGATATEILHFANHHDIILRDGAMLSAENIILAVTPQIARRLLPSSPSLQASLDAQTPVKAACLTLSLDRVPDPACTFATSIERPFYYSLHSAAAELAPQGGGLAHLAYYKSERDSAESDAIRTELETFMTHLQPGWRSHLVAAEFLPDMTVYHALPKVGIDRPAVEITDLNNVYLVGDWVEVGEILADASVASANIVARQILETRRILA